MPSVYVSSTFKDLREHRQVAINTLDRLGYSTRAMEKYFASDERPLDLCLADVARCDLYIGIFARRYGTVPLERNPEGRSITECEFREAVRLGIPCLIFLSDESDRWPVDGADDQAQVARLRKELAAGWTCAYFDTPERLGLEVSVAVAGWQSNPDFDQYLHALVAEFADLPELPGHTKNLSIGEIMTIAVSLPDASEGAQVSFVELPQAVALQRTVVLVGEGGAGKSTALRFLAYHHARARLQAIANGEGLQTTFLPIYVQLRGGHANLRDQLWAALQRPNFHCSRELFDRWLAEQPFLFLIDRLESVDVRSTIEDLAELLQHAARARVVVASRPDRSLTDCPWLQAHLQPPSDAGLAAFFSALLGSERGGELFDMLARNALLEPFRRPLFARFLALSSPELMRQDRLTPAAMFQDVVEGRFLNEWERLDGAHDQRAIMREFLARIAHHMIVANTDTVTQHKALLIAQAIINRRGVLADRHTLENVVDRPLRHGLLTEVDGGLQFWHSSFRDYFAAVWLEQHASALTVYRRSWSPRWHECLVYYFGLLHDGRLERVLRSLLFGFRVNVAILHIGPNPRISGRLLLVLRCLVQAGATGRKWHGQVLRQLPTAHSSFFLSGTPTPIEYSPHWDGYAPHRYLCDLVGQLRSPEGFAYLDEVDATLDVVAPGLLHNPDQRVIARLAEVLVDDTEDWRGRSGDQVLSHLLLRSRDPRCFAALRRVACDKHAMARAKLLELLAHTMVWHRHDNDLRKLLIDEWGELLIGFALHDEDENVRRSAVTFLRELGQSEHERGSLPAPAYYAFLRSLTDANSAVRARALSAFRIPALAHHLDVLWRFLDDEDFGVVLDALFHFRHCGGKQRFCRATLKVLRRYATDDVRTVAALFYKGLREQHSGVDLPLRSIALMMSSALCGTYYGVTLYAVLALGRLAGEWAVPFFTHLLRSNAWEETRSAALDILIKLLGVDAGDLVAEMLSDASARVRGDAAADCYIHDFGPDFPPRVGVLLFELVSDESEFASRYATSALQKYGYLAKDWYRYQGNPIYLGPPAPTATDT